MSPNLGSRRTTWSTVSSGFREIEIGWDRLGSVSPVAPSVSPASRDRKTSMCQRHFSP